MLRRSLVVPAALVVSLFASFASREAHAESGTAPQRCSDVQLLPSGNGVPTNLPALVVDESGASAGFSTTIEITKVSGGTSSLQLGVIDDSTTPDTRLLVAATNDPLEADTTYTIEYSARCSTGTVEPSTTTFKTGAAAVALPTTIGAVTKQYADGVSITPSPELRAFLRTTRFVVSVDGNVFGSTRYGVDTANDLEVQLSQYGVSVSNVVASGARAVCTSAGVEKHQVTLAAHVAGVESTNDPKPMTFEIELDCGKAVATPVYLPDGGSEGRGASDRNYGDDTSDGCSVRGPGPVGRLASLFMAGAGVAVLLRRRRK